MNNNKTYEKLIEIFKSKTSYNELLYIENLELDQETKDLAVDLFYAIHHYFLDKISYTLQDIEKLIEDNQPLDEQLLKLIKSKIEKNGLLLENNDISYPIFNFIETVRESMI